MKKWLFVLAVLLLPALLFAGVKAEDGEKSLTVGMNLDARVNYDTDNDETSYYYGDSSLKLTFQPADGFNSFYWEMRPDGEQGIKIKRAYVDSDLAKALGLDCSLTHRIGRQTVEAYDYSFTDSGFELFEPSYTQNATMATFGYKQFQGRVAYIAQPDAITMAEASLGFDKILYHLECGVWAQNNNDTQMVMSVSGGGAGFTLGAGALISEDAENNAGAAVMYSYKGAYVAGALNTLDQWDVNAGYSKGNVGFDASYYYDGENASFKPWIWAKVGGAKFRLVYDTFPKKLTWRVNYSF